jgi:glutathione peroxidase
MTCCGGSCCGGKPWGLMIVVLAAAGAGAVTFMVTDKPGADASPAIVHQVAQPAAKPTQPQEQDVTKDPAYVLGHAMKLIDGTDQDLGAYKGKVVVFVNVASKCGYTPQYEGLEKLYREKKDSGLVILGFPANNFGGQEPGTNAEVAEFCKSSYGVTFPMFEKISVKGEDQHPLYRQLAAQPEPIGGDPKWNFTKFVADKSGRVAARFDSKAKPDDKDFIARIDELLAQE